MRMAEEPGGFPLTQGVLGTRTGGVHPDMAQRGNPSFQSAGAMAAQQLQQATSAQSPAAPAPSPWPAPHGQMLAKALPAQQQHLQPGPPPQGPPPPSAWSHTGSSAAAANPGVWPAWPPRNVQQIDRLAFPSHTGESWPAAAGSGGGAVDGGRGCKRDHQQGPGAAASGGPGQSSGPVTAKARATAPPQGVAAASELPQGFAAAAGAAPAADSSGDRQPDVGTGNTAAVAGPVTAVPDADVAGEAVCFHVGDVGSRIVRKGSSTGKWL